MCQMKKFAEYFVGEELLGVVTLLIKMVFCAENKNMILA